VRPVRRDDATHPRELPDPERFVPLTDLEEDACQVCHETGDVYDPVGHFKDPSQLGAYVLAHGDCGEANGLELA
jgi:hypothetical protein